MFIQGTETKESRYHAIQKLYRIGYIWTWLLTDFQNLTQIFFVLQQV